MSPPPPPQQISAMPRRVVILGALGALAATADARLLISNAAVASSGVATLASVLRGRPRTSPQHAEERALDHIFDAWAEKHGKTYDSPQGAPSVAIFFDNADFVEHNDELARAPLSLGRAQPYGMSSEEFPHLGFAPTTIGSAVDPATWEYATSIRPRRRIGSPRARWQ